jgi:hypothetical protein
MKFLFPKKFFKTYHIVPVKLIYDHINHNGKTSQEILHHDLFENLIQGRWNDKKRKFYKWGIYAKHYLIILYQHVVAFISLS